MGPILYGGQVAADLKVAHGLEVLLPLEHLVDEDEQLRPRLGLGGLPFLRQVLHFLLDGGQPGVEAEPSPELMQLSAWLI